MHTDFYDRELRLAYHGQFDASRPGAKVLVSGHLRAAVAALLHGRAPATQQIPSIG